MSDHMPPIEAYRAEFERQYFEENRVRFAVGSDQRHSGSWRAWGHAGSCYISARTAGRDIKISLHPSGKFRLAFDEKQLPRLEERGIKLPDGQDRALAKWKRRPAPESGTALILTFPTDCLALGPPAALSMKQPVAIFPCARPGMAIEVWFIYTSEAATTFKPELSKIGHPHFRLDFAHDETMWIVLREAPFTFPEISAGPWQRFWADDVAVGEERRNLTMALWAAPEAEGDPLRVIELSEVTATRVRKK